MFTSMYRPYLLKYSVFLQPYKGSLKEASWNLHGNLSWKEAKCKLPMENMECVNIFV